MVDLQDKQRAENAGQLAGQIVVLLEDDDLIRRATERLLRRVGADVVSGTGSAEVLEKISADGLAPACVIADYWLNRDENGVEAADTIRTALSQICDKIPRCIILTGDVSTEIADAVERAGYRLLRKPVDIDAFLGALAGNS